MRVCLTLCWTLVLSASAVAAEIQGSSFYTGVWEGGAYTSDQTGRFSHCAISTPYESGDSLFFFARPDGTFNLGVSKREPVFKTGQAFPVTFAIDRRNPFQGEGVATSETFVVLSIYESQRALDALKRGSILRILSEHGRSGYKLGGTFKAFETTRRCADHYRNYAGTPVARAPAPAAPSTSAADPVDQSILYQIATDQIAGIGVKDSRYLRPEEIREFINHDGVFWVSEAASLYGGVYIRASGGIGDLRESDPADLHEISSGCAGDIISGSRDVSADDFQIREMRAMCSLETHVNEIIVNKTLIEDIILYTVLMFSDPLGSPAPADREEERRELGQTMATRAAVFVVNGR